jgi:hypothetical protein
MSNDDPVFLSAFIEYLDTNFLSRKEKKIIYQARSCLYAKNQLLAHHFGKKNFFCLH